MTDIPKLTGQEIKVMNLAAEGVENGCISSKLKVSVHLVNNRLQTIYRKLNISGHNARVILTHFALHEGLPNLFDRPNRKS